MTTTKNQWDGLMTVLTVSCNDILSVLGLYSGYTVKYTPLPSGEGVYLTVYPSSRPNTDTR